MRLRFYDVVSFSGYTMWKDSTSNEKNWIGVEEYNLRSCPGICPKENYLSIQKLDPYLSSLKNSPILFSMCERIIIVAFSKERQCPYPPLKFHGDKYHLQKYYVYGVEWG
jgi:hypothetical protein